MAELAELCPPELIEEAAKAAHARQVVIVGERINRAFPTWEELPEHSRQDWRDTILAAFRKVEWHDPKLCCCQHCPHRGHCRD